MTNKDPYEILQVRQDAEKEVIDAAYRSLARKYHPDANKSTDTTTKMQAINWAYDILGNDLSRQKWDRVHNPAKTRNTQADEEIRKADEEIKRQKAHAEVELQKKKQADENRRKAEEERRQQQARIEEEQRKKEQLIEEQRRVEEEIRRQKAHFETVKRYQKKAKNPKESRIGIGLKSLIVVFLSVGTLYAILFRFSPGFSDGVKVNPTTIPTLIQAIPTMTLTRENHAGEIALATPTPQYQRTISFQEASEKESALYSFIDKLRNQGYFYYQNGHYQYLGDREVTQEHSSWESLGDSVSSFIVQGKVSWDSKESNPKNVGCGFAIRGFENGNYTGDAILAFIENPYDVFLTKIGKTDANKESELSNLANVPGKEGTDFSDQPFWGRNEPVKFTLVSLGTKVFIFLDEKEKITKLFTPGFKGRPSTLFMTEDLSINNTCYFQDIELFVFAE